MYALETIDSKGEAPQRRFKNAASARNVYGLFLEQDKEASKKRARNQRMFDGARPYTDAELEKAGQKFRTNVNFGQAEDLLAESLGSYIDMLQSVDVLFSCPTKFGETPEQREQYSKEICREISNMVKQWDDFFQQYLLNATNFISQGVSMAVFPDSWDWRFEVKGMDDIKTPRDAKARIDAWEVFYVRESYSVSKLWRIISNESAAKERGWNVAEVKRMLAKACGKNERSEELAEDWATRIKNDDLHLSYRSEPIDLLFAFVQEFDGSVTQYLLSESGESEEWLYERRNAYKSMSEAASLFVFGVGNKGKLHEIRGLGSKIFASVQVLNRLYCQGIDGTMLASALMVKPGSLSDIGKQQFVFFGPYAVLHPNAKLEATSVPPFANNTLPVVRTIGELMRTKSNGFTSTRALPEDPRRMSQFEAQARINTAAGMTVVNLVLFMEQFEKLLRQVVKRVCRKGYSKDLPGGEYVSRLYKKLEELGIPKEAVHGMQVEDLEITYPVGAGSPAAREMAYRSLREWSAGFDETGQRNLTRNAISNIIGSYRGADSYVPPANSTRAPEETKLAILENHQMSQGASVPVFSEEFHVNHLEQHAPYMAQVNQQVDEGGMALEEAVPLLLEIHQHSLEHLKFIEGDPMKVEAVTKYREVLQQSGEIIFNGLRRLRSMQEQQAREAQAGGGQPEGPSADEIKRQSELQHMWDKHELNMRILESEAQAKLQAKMLQANADAQIRAAKAASEINPFMPGSNLLN